MPALSTGKSHVSRIYGFGSAAPSFGSAVFMMTLSVAYYLVDISFKLGFAIIAMPITVGLWPFNITKGKLASCFSIVLRSRVSCSFWG